MLAIQPMQQHHHEQVALLSVAPEQLPFVGTIDEILSNIGAYTHAHVLTYDEQVVGFFLLDLSYSQGYLFCPPSGAGLRAYFVDSAQQGKGYGSTAMKLLPHYVKQHYPAVCSVYLTVNCRNLSAQNCYLKAGFVDSGELYLGGSAGPQHIMKIAIM